MQPLIPYVGVLCARPLSLADSVARGVLRPNVHGRVTDLFIPSCRIQYGRSVE